jgi:hypothetical protein
MFVKCLGVGVGVSVGVGVGVGRGRRCWALACKTATEAWVAFFIFFVNFDVVSVRKVNLQCLAQ